MYLFIRIPYRIDKSDEWWNLKSATARQQMNVNYLMIGPNDRIKFNWLMLVKWIHLWNVCTCVCALCTPNNVYNLRRFNCFTQHLSDRIRMHGRYWSRHRLSLSHSLTHFNAIIISVNGSYYWCVWLRSQIILSRINMHETMIWVVVATAAAAEVIQRKQKKRSISQIT